MAFRGRGDVPSIDNNIGEERKNRNYYGGYYRRWCYVPLDNTYVIMQMIATFIIVIVGFVAYLLNYKSSIIDPIENIKNTFINIYSIILLILLGLVIFTNFFSKTKESLIKKLIIIFVISILIMLIFWVIKINYDTTYNKNKFEQIYLEQNTTENETKNTQKKPNNYKYDLGLGGLSVKTEKEYYIDECMELYNIFKIKGYVMLVLHLLLNLLLIYQIIKVINMQEKKDRISKDDLILFDEEQNVRF